MTALTRPTRLDHWRVDLLPEGYRVSSGYGSQLLLHAPGCSSVGAVSDAEATDLGRCRCGACQDDELCRETDTLRLAVQSLTDADLYSAGLTAHRLHRALTSVHTGYWGFLDRFSATLSPSATRWLHAVLDATRDINDLDGHWRLEQDEAAMLQRHLPQARPQPAAPVTGTRWILFTPRVGHLYRTGEVVEPVSWLPARPGLHEPVLAAMLSARHVRRLADGWFALLLNAETTALPGFRAAPVFDAHHDDDTTVLDTLVTMIADGGNMPADQFQGLVAAVRSA